MKEIDYREAGVDIDSGNAAVELMKQHVRSTFTEGVMGDIGGFGGFFNPGFLNLKEPVLVSGTDGVGTKLKIAFMLNRHDTVGIDCVAMSVNDIITTGATPLFFLDYIALGKLDPEKVAEVVKGIAEGCRQASCALIGGETAEMPGFYPDNEYDLAGFAVGLVDKEKIIDGNRIEAGDVLIGLPSSGLHSNGYSLARYVLFNAAGLTIDSYIPELSSSIGEELIKPTSIYVNSFKKANGAGTIKGMAHITGGGLLENVPRIIPQGLGVEMYADSWELPGIFSYIQKLGNVNTNEMYRTFNMGIGMVLVISEKDAVAVLSALEDDKPRVIGRVMTGISGVRICSRG